MTEPTSEQQHVAAIHRFAKGGELPEPCDDRRCAFCNAWYAAYPHDRREAYSRRMAALQPDRAA